MAKAVPRASTLEERALAAEKARQKYLARVAASCAEEVKRAKRVAEEIKERREAEGRRLREDMEEKLAEAERRRVEYQKNIIKRGRTISAPRVVDKKLLREKIKITDRAEAALKIQQAWRTTRRRRITKDFIDLGLSVEGAGNTSFEDVRAILSQETVIRCTARVLQLCGLQDAAGDSRGEGTLVRTFLSAYLILGHPAEVLSYNGEQENDLVTKSKGLLTSFERLLPRITPSTNYTPPPAQVERLSAVYKEYLSAFSVWKAQDCENLLHIMLAQYVELDRIWQKIKNETEEVVRVEYRDGIRENQVLLLVRIKRLVGPEKAKTVVRDAIRAARKNRSKKPAGDGASEPAPDVSPAPANLEGSNPALLANNQNVLPPSDTDADSVQVERLARVLSIVPDNRTLTHEVAVNRGYRIQTDSIINSKPRAAVKQAVFDSMRVDVENGRDQRWIVAMAINIKSKLLRLLTPGNSLYILISEALDPAVIARECSMGSFSYEKFFSFMNSVLPRLCAPFRDPEVKALAEDHRGDVIDRLARMMHIIDLLSLDYANYLLQESVPRLVEEAPGYEERCFAQDLENGIISLQRTEQWWKRAREQAFAEAIKRDPEGVNHPSNKPTSGKIYMRGLTDLFIAVSELDDAELPETLRLDRERIVNARDDILRIIVASSILLTAKNLLKRDVRSPWKSEATRIWDLLKDNMYSTNAATTIQTMLETSHALPPTTKTQLGSLIARITSQAHSRQLTDPVMRLLFHRLKTHVLNRLLASTTTSADRIRANNTATEGLAASGLSEFIGRIGELVEEMGKVGEVDRASHGRWYEEITQRADQEAVNA